METKKIVYQMFGEDMKQNTTTVIEDGIVYRIGLSTSNNVCTISVKARINKLKDATKYVELLNQTQAKCYRYFIKDNFLICKIYVWVDCKINKTTLSELLSTVDANYRSVLNYLHQGKKNYA